MKRDRYTFGLSLIVVGFWVIIIGLLILVVLKQLRLGFFFGFIGSIVLAVGFIYSLVITFTPARFHFYIEGMQIKDKKGNCHPVEPNKPFYTGNGICIKENGIYKHYKAVDGVDICFQNGKIVPCGWGSGVIQSLLSGGWEVPSIEEKV